MRVKFADGAARAAGMPEHSLALHASLTVREVLVILGNLYPGFGSWLYSNRPLIHLNGQPVGPDSPITDADLLEVHPVSPGAPGF